MIKNSTEAECRALNAEIIARMRSGDGTVKEIYNHHRNKLAKIRSRVDPEVFAEVLSLVWEELWAKDELPPDYEAYKKYYPTFSEE